MVFKTPVTNNSNESPVCPPGEHFVSSHWRILSSGKKTWVISHCRKNSGKKTRLTLYPENLRYLYLKPSGPFRKLKPIQGFKGHHELDPIIQFWLRHWKKTGLKFPHLDPLLIKTIIAVESSFQPKASAPKGSGSTAYGLMQVTNQSRRILSGNTKEMKRPYLILSRKDLEDSVLTVAAGTRWLIHKHYLVRKKSGKPIYNLLKAYFSWNKEGDAYAEKILGLYKKSK